MTPPGDVIGLLSAACERMNALAAAWQPPGGTLVRADRVVWQEKRDPFSGAPVHVGRWPPDADGRRGEIQVNDDGSFFAEHDVLAWEEGQFVEAVTAWGRSDRLCGEVRRLTAPD